jgi:hypothetical protein
MNGERLNNNQQHRVATRIKAACREGVPYEPERSWGNEATTRKESVGVVCDAKRRVVESGVVGAHRE